ncbi:MAG: IPTL-CTERM sorting domain-containing protein [Proteobacteria bacterium]|nr:IPTL-CTERM sorting domain-containing protein [Pseudomonadota bacterium]
MLKRAAHLVAIASLASLPVAATAAPYAITFTDTVVQSAIPLIANGTSATLTLVVDNGGTTAASQNWDSTTLQCAIFRFAGGAYYVAINTPATHLTSTSGSVVTDASGALTAVPSAWYEGPTVSADRVATNITSAGFDYWYDNSANNVIFWNNGYELGFSQVGTESSPGSWSNPAPAPGLCASYPYGGKLASSVAVPTLDATSLGLLASLVGLLGAWVGLRRQA